MMNATIIIPDEPVDALNAYRRECCSSDPLEEALQAIVHEYLTSHRYLMPALPKRLHIAPAEHGSGRGDLSVNHDQYLAEALLQTGYQERVDCP